MNFALLLAGFLTMPAFAAECPQAVEKVTCLITFNDGSGPKNQEVNFEVKESTFLCDGKPNQYFSTEKVIGKKFVAFIYANFESMGLGIYDKADKERMKEYAHTQSPRIKNADKEMQSFQSVSANLPGGNYAQIMCEPAAE